MATQSEPTLYTRDPEEEEEEEKKGIKSNVRRYLENHYVEIGILILVLVDVALVSVEAGIDFKIICIGGKEVPHGSPAGAHLLHGHDSAPSHGNGHTYSFLLGEGSVLSPESAVLGFAARAWSGKALPALFQRPSLNPNASLGLKVVPKMAQVRLPARVAGVSRHQGDLSSKIEVVRHTKSRDSSQPEQNATVWHGRSEGHQHEHSHHAGIQDNKQATFQTDHHEGHHHDESHGAHPDVLVCEGHHGHMVHHIAHTCHVCSILILCIFSLELALKIWVVPHFLADFFHKLDCVVVALSLLTDTLVVWVISMMRSNQEANEGWADVISGMLLLSRFWRVVRIVHGLYEFEEKKQDVSASHLEHQASGHHETSSSQV